MTLRQLRYIIKIVECGSITEASKQLFISQPSLSAAVKELEKELGIEIFYRTTKGITLSIDGNEFLSYARQVIEQTQLLEQRYTGKNPPKRLCSISTQHYAFAVNAFVELLSELDVEEYEFTLRETRTNEIIEDVTNLRSEIGVIYLSDFNEKVINKLLKENHLRFNFLFEASAHVFVSSKHPLADNKRVTLEDLEDYPFLAFEQGEYNSFYFSEEILSTVPRKKNHSRQRPRDSFQPFDGLKRIHYLLGRFKRRPQRRKYRFGAACFRRKNANRLDIQRQIAFKPSRFKLHLNT